MKQTLVILSCVVAAIVALGSVWWFRTPDSPAGGSMSSLSTFTIPPGLDASDFAARIITAGFSLVPDVNFNSLLPEKYQRAEFATMPAFQQPANSASATRILGHSTGARSAHLFTLEAGSSEHAQQFNAETDAVLAKLTK